MKISTEIQVFQFRPSVYLAALTYEILVYHMKTLFIPPVVHRGWQSWYKMNLARKKALKRVVFSRCQRRELGATGCIYLSLHL